MQCNVSNSTDRKGQLATHSPPIMLVTGAVWTSPTSDTVHGAKLAPHKESDKVQWHGEGFNFPGAFPIICNKA